MRPNKDCYAWLLFFIRDFGWISWYCWVLIIKAIKVVVYYQQQPPAMQSKIDRSHRRCPTAFWRNSVKVMGHYGTFLLLITLSIEIEINGLHGSLSRQWEGSESGGYILCVCVQISIEWKVPCCCCVCHCQPVDNPAVFSFMFFSGLIYSCLLSLKHQRRAAEQLPLCGLWHGTNGN